MSRTRRWLPRVLVALGLLWAVALTGLVVVRGDEGEPTTAASPTPSPSPSGPMSVAEVHEAVAPSVVLIQRGGALGTGVVANADGTILTAFHVVDGAGSITVTFADGTRAQATIAETAPAIDIATLTPARLPELLVPATLGGGAAVGDGVVALGNPLGLTDTTTSGVVSALDRSVPREGGGARLSGLIQFDAAVNPGSSGGPLVDLRGEVVGIVVALANPTSAGTFIGVGFAVPIGAAVGAGEGDGRQPPL